MDNMQGPLTKRATDRYNEVREYYASDAYGDGYMTAVREEATYAKVSAHYATLCDFEKAATFAWFQVAAHRAIIDYQATR